MACSTEGSIKYSPDFGASQNLNSQENYKLTIALISKFMFH